MTLTHQAEVLTWTEPEPMPLRGTVILLPGRGESPQVYERLGKRLAADAYRVHVVTAPSDSPDQARAQLTGLLETADADKPRVVAGSDGGAAYAAHLAARAELPGVNALILAGLPTAATASTARDWDGELDARSFCPTHRGRISASGVRAGELFTDLPPDWFDAQAAARISLPVLGLHGREDTVSPLADARDFYAAVPHAELVSIAGGPHDVLNDQTHRTVAATIVLFLERLRGGAGLPPIALAEPLRAGSPA
ncbi:alpha/beta hydrolase [Actinoplanes sp. TFC3]|uniref:alpha/beta hydrolase n=1 Tax=Actinoplanes sp. TFC3 TaxID=1710355 RepID=UPI00082C4707|nr:alpha/beta hydrolase [Actinoplanes sp. TFC3]